VGQVQQIGPWDRALVIHVNSNIPCSIGNTIPSFSNRRSPGKWFFPQYDAAEAVGTFWVSNTWKPKVWSARRGQARSRIGGGSKSQA
jgi:hypothetical protein